MKGKRVGLHLLLLLAIMRFASIFDAQASTAQTQKLSILTTLDYDIGAYKQPTVNGLDQLELFVATSQSAKLRLMAISGTGTSLRISELPEFSNNGNVRGRFQLMPEELLKQNNISVGQNILLREVTKITSDMLLFPVLEAPLRNVNPAKIDFAYVRLQLNGLVKIASAADDLAGLNNGNELLLKIYETGTNSGVFVGYIPFSANAVPTNVTQGRVRYPVLAGGNRSVISAQYREEKENNAVSRSVITVDIARAERGKVFDSVSGRLINGIELSLIDEKTGKVAKIFGDDGVSTFPSVIKTGETYQDSSGKEYKFSEGRYYFPSVPPGKYRLSVGNVPNNYVFPSTLNKKNFANGSPQKLDGESVASGKSFSLFFDAVIAQDIPLDPRASLILEKTALVKTAGAGDLIPYEVRLNNTDPRTGRGLIFYDRPALETRLVPGSVTVNDVKVNNIKLDPETGAFSFTLPDMRRGEAVTIRYGTRVTAAPVQENRIMKNAAYVTGAGGFVTNQSIAEVTYKDDMLQADATILGRVMFDDCNGNLKKNKLNKKDIVGLAKARLFLQDGTQIVTDEYGKFSIPNVKPGRHVLQLDGYALPKGVKPVLCKDNTRRAGTAFSQFIDVSGGFVYKANFSVTGDKEKFRPIVKKKSVFDPSKPLPPGADPNKPGQWGKNTPIGYFNAEWLDTQNNEFSLVYPGVKFNPSIKSLNFGVKYPNGHRVKAYINNEPVSQLNLETVFADKNNTVRIAHWRGVDLNRDTNTLKLVLIDENNKELQVITHDVFFNQKVYKAEALPKESVLKADGLNKPELAFLLTDKKGSPVGAGTPVRVSIESPYAFDREGLYQRLGDRPNTQNSGDTQDLYTEADGRLILRLQPTAQSGKVSAKVYLSGNDYREFDFWLKPEKREWILVGLADGTVGHKKVSENMQAADINKIEDGFNNNGKLAFYTKGVISEDWLVTAAFDSSKRKATERERIFQSVDPTKTYPVLGDQSSITKDAPSQYPLYIKVEKERFYALFGDYDTGLTESKLASYSRRMSGFKTVYREDNFTVTAFASEDGQIYFRDEIRSDGTSGPFKLRAENLLIGSDRISVEVRDRLDRTKVLESRFLSRFLDYDIDYQDGTFSLRLPLSETDGAFNPQFIIADYETNNQNVTNKSFGARAEKKLVENTDVGVTALRDGGGDRSNKTDLLATDVKVKLTETVNFEAELARTAGVGGPLLSANGVNAQSGEDVSANAVRTELKHEGESLYSNVYYEKRENGFGVAGASAFGAASQAFGAESVYNFDRHENEKTDVKEAEDQFTLAEGASVYGKVRREQDELNRGALSTAELGARKEIDNYSFYTGLRSIKENISFSYLPTSGGAAENFASNGTVLQWMNGIESEVIRDRLNLFASSELPISSDGQSAVYGERNLVGGDVRVSDSVHVKSAYQWADIGGQDYESALAGLQWAPLDQTVFNVGADQHFVGAQEFSSGTAGVIQTVPITENTVLTLGAERKEALSGQTGSYSDLAAAPQYSLPSFVRDGAIAGPFNNSGELWESRNTLTAGGAYNTEALNANLVSQFRDSDSERRLNLNGSVIGATNKDLALGVQAGYQISTLKDDLTIDDYLDRLRNGAISRGGVGEYYGSREARFIKDSSVATLSSGASYRPLDEDGPIILQRADLQYLKNETEEDILKIINNLAVQSNVTDRLETSAQYAIKYVEDNFNGNQQSEIVQVVGNETRYDIRKDVDVGAQGLIRHSSATDSKSYSAGLSAGYTPAKNIYVQAGYNFVGFRDNDFSLLGYTAQGPYLRVSAKFDQGSVKENVKDVLGR